MRARAHNPRVLKRQHTAAPRINFVYYTFARAIATTISEGTEPSEATFDNP